ncbi:MAG TPA: class I SAM-dependent methyltransferase [Candidatus Nanopelagicaceae bacterium]|nr:class I SAM-dependent methyltransferase [Candidatus Nanopelagicaceae bacterium]
MEIDPRSKAGPGHGAPSDWDRRHEEHQWSSEPDPLLVGLASPLPPGRALDLGCGTGRNALWLARQGWQVTGIDGSAVGLAKAREQARAAGLELELIQADIMDHALALGHYELVVMANLHFAPEVLALVLARAASSVAPAGHLFLIGHHLDNLDNLDHHGPPMADRLYTEERISELLPPILVAERLERCERTGGSDLDQRHDISLLVWASAKPARKLPGSA